MAPSGLCVPLPGRWIELWSGKNAASGVGGGGWPDRPEAGRVTREMMLVARMAPRVA